MNTQQTALSMGFKDKVIDAGDCFRVVQEAMAQPAKIIPLPVSLDENNILNNGALAFLLTLADIDTQVYLAPDHDNDQTRQYLQFHTGCAITTHPEEAVFAVMDISADLSICSRFSVGSEEYPDRSATIILLCDKLTDDTGTNFSGPGIKTTRQFNPVPVPANFWETITVNQQYFPCGLDWVFASEKDLAALPRTTKVELSPCM